MFRLPPSKPFLTQIINQLHAKHLNINDLFIDHICYRVETTERYYELKNELEKENQLLVESTVNGRNIAVFKLKQPITFQHWEIPLLELPSPKSGSHYEEGWEHIECVTNEPLESFIENHPNLTFDLKGFSKPINREIRLNLGKSSVKFHEMSLLRVIELEQSQ